MVQEFYKDVTITTRGQLTLPASIRRALRVGVKRKVRLELTPPDTVTLRPLPDVTSFYGALRGGAPYQAQEKRKAREALGRRAGSWKK